MSLMRAAGGMVPSVLDVLGLILRERLFPALGRCRLRAGTRRCRAGRVDANEGADDVDAARVDGEEAAGALDGELRAGLEDHLVTRLEVDLFSGFEGVLVADLLVLVDPDGE